MAATSKTHLSFLIWVLAFATGCFSSQPDRPPGYLVIGIESSPTQLDPRYATDANSTRVAALVFDPLTRTDENARVEPDLAERWEKVDDRTYLFHLRKGVRFQNGKPLTAEDVKFTYQFILDPNNQSPRRSELSFLEKVDAVGPYSVRFRLSSPYAAFLVSAASLGIVPAGSPPLKSRRGAALPGTGPFSIEEFLPGEKLALRANPSYWRGAPAVPGLVMKIIPDAIVRALEFKKGTIDLLQNDIEPDMLPWLKRNTDASIISRQGTTFQYLGMNLNDPVLKHNEVRQAIAYAIDRESIIRHLLKGLAVPATGLRSPLHWAYESSVRQWPYNPEEAKRLLDQAGFPDPDGDGPLPRFKLSYKTTTLDLRRRIAEAIKEQLARVGIELEVRSYEWGTFYGDIQKGDFQLYSLAWVGVTDPDIYFNLFHSSSFPPNGNNRGHYRNPEVDRLLEEGRKSASLEERKRIYARVQQILALELPYVPLWWTKNVVVMNPAIRGFVPYPDGDLISLRNVSLISHQSQS